MHLTRHCEIDWSASIWGTKILEHFGNHQKTNQGLFLGGSLFCCGAFLFKNKKYLKKLFFRNFRTIAHDVKEKKKPQLFLLFSYFSRCQDREYAESLHPSVQEHIHDIYTNFECQICVNSLLLSENRKHFLFVSLFQ